MADSEIWRLSATQTAAMVAAGSLSAVDAVEACLRRIEDVEPAINAFATVCAERARAAARERDRARAGGTPAGPLEGVCMHVKDLIPTKGVETSYGSFTMAGNVPDVDVRVVERLAAAGAILVGKSTTPEYGCKILTDSPRYGRTLNPWNLERTSGGSSGGAAAAVAAGMGPIAVSTDGAGSARVPAACCGVLGFKPSIGLLPNDMAAALFENHQYIGFNARTTADLAAVLTVANGPDPVDPWTMGRPRVDFALGPDPAERLRGLRILYVPSMGDRHSHLDVCRLMDIAIGRLAAEGVKVEVLHDPFDWGAPANAALIRCSLYGRLGHLLNEHRERMEPVLVSAIEAAAAMRTEDVVGLPLARTRLFHRVQALFERADLIVSPTIAAPAIRADHRADQPLVIEGQIAGSLREAWYPYTPFANITGHPAISVPIGYFEDGTPAGLHAVGRLHEDARLLDLAAAIEAVWPWAARWPECRRAG